jgi:hypothetical protein
VSLLGEGLLRDILRILSSVVSGVSRRHHQSPTQAQEPAGQDPEAPLTRSRGRSTDALYQAKVQLFLEFLWLGAFR